MATSGKVDAQLLLLLEKVQKLVPLQCICEQYRLTDELNYRILLYQIAFLYNGKHCITSEPARLFSLLYSCDVHFYLLYLLILPLSVCTHTAYTILQQD